MSIYRGYEIERKPDGYAIKLGDKTVATEPTEEAAMAWVDQSKRAARQKEQT